MGGASCFQRRRLLSGIFAGVFFTVAVGACAQHPARGAVKPRSGSARAPARHGAASLIKGIGALRLGSSWTEAGGYNRYSQLIVSRGYARQAAHARGRSLIHFSGTDVNERYSTGVSFERAKAQGWLLKSSDGSLLQNEGYPGTYIADVGNPAYAKRWVADVARFLRVYGDDGVMIDDVVRDIKPLAGGYPAKYPTQSQWQAAMASFVRIAGVALRKQGFYVAVNAPGYTPGDARSDDGTLDIAWWRQLAPSVDGLLNEYYQQNPSGDHALRSSGEDSSENWDGWQRLEQTVEGMGKDFIALSYGASNDSRTMTYARASFLLDWNGGTSAFVYNPTDNSDPWNGAWTRNIGGPVAPRKRVGVGWERRYSGGMALLNTSASEPQTFTLKARYRLLSGEPVRSVTLDPTTGLILVKRRR